MPAIGPDGPDRYTHQAMMEHADSLARLERRVQELQCEVEAIRTFEKTALRLVIGTIVLLALGFGIAVIPPVG